MSIKDILQNSKTFWTASLILLALLGVGVVRLVKIEEGREPVLVENEGNVKLVPTSSRPIWHADPIKKAKPKKSKKPHNKVDKK